MLKWLLFGEMPDKKRRRVGMADEADSKSVVGNHVRVQVPLPALEEKLVSKCLRAFSVIEKVPRPGLPRERGNRGK